ncbi:Uncharacterised protein [Bordetella pertussis]|nr:Uncharacterised protein [Bordetella pertussis]
MALARAMVGASGSAWNTQSARPRQAVSSSSSRYCSACARLASVHTTALSPASRMSACGKPTNTEAAITPSDSSALQRACSDLLGSACVPWRMMCGSIGLLAQLMTGLISPRSVRAMALAARSPAARISTCG